MHKVFSGLWSPTWRKQNEKALMLTKLLHCCYSNADQVSSFSCFWFVTKMLLHNSSTASPNLRGYTTPGTLYFLFISDRVSDWLVTKYVNVRSVTLHTISYDVICGEILHLARFEILSQFALEANSLPDLTINRALHLLSSINRKEMLKYHGSGHLGMTK